MRKTAKGTRTVMPVETETSRNNSFMRNSATSFSIIGAITGFFVGLYFAWLIGAIIGVLVGIIGGVLLGILSGVICSMGTNINSAITKNTDDDNQKKRVKYISKIMKAKGKGAIEFEEAKNKTKSVSKEA
ncbi:MAG: hypothetical protein LBJ09_00815 [Clostridiales bacterium]|jgi:flagellar motor component MotA|nr:hypothetical protein [Clostridiales bacterium]